MSCLLDTLPNIWYCIIHKTWNVSAVFDSNISAQKLQDCAKWSWVFLTFYLSQKWRTLRWESLLLLLLLPLLLLLLLRQRFYFWGYYLKPTASQHSALKWQTLNPCLPCPPPLLCPFLNTFIHSSIPCPTSPDFPHCHLYIHIDTHPSRCLIFAFSHTLGVDSKRKTSTTPRTPKLLSPPISSSCAHYSRPSEA